MSIPPTDTRIPVSARGGMTLRHERDSLSEDEVFDLLSSPRRRSVLRHLGRDGEPIRLQRLAELIAARENDKTVDRLTDRERKRVYVSLYQTHVPAMVEAGVIEYESESGRIVPTAATTRLRTHLTPDKSRLRPRLGEDGSGEGRDDVWRLTNAGLAAVGILALLVIAVTSSAIDSIQGLLTVLLVALGTLALSLLATRWTHPGSRSER